jgi:hypothetical protein
MSFATLAYVLAGGDYELSFTAPAARRQVVEVKRQPGHPSHALPD